MIYTGQEVGNKKAFEFFKYDSVPDYTPNEFTAFYQMLNTLKHTQPALDAGIDGGAMLRYPTENVNVYVFTRKKGDSEVLVMTNLSDKEAAVKFTGDKPSVSGMTDWFAGSEAAVPESLGAWESKVFVRK